MKKLTLAVLALISSAIAFPQRNAKEIKPFSKQKALPKIDFSKQMKKSLGLADFDFKSMDISKVIKGNKSAKEAPKSTIATLLILSESAIHHYPKPEDAATQNVIRYKGDYVSKQQITDAKQFLMIQADSHPDLLTGRQLAQGTLARSFSEDPEVVVWAANRLYKRDYEIKEYTGLLNII